MRDIHSHDTRNRNLLTVATGTKNFTFLSARIWNAIVSKININVSLSQFKNILRFTYCTTHLYIPIQNKVNNYLDTVFSIVAWLLIKTGILCNIYIIIYYQYCYVYIFICRHISLN